MNGWAEPEPAWWLNLQAHPEATVELPDGSRARSTARAATGDERERLWARFLDLRSSAFTDANAALRSRRDGDRRPRAASRLATDIGLGLRGRSGLRELAS